jgi:S-DNA-T family DNA segregation ATPase FtsK/SpoIIIE
MGAEQLLGSGDMLFLENGANLIRLHGGYVSENEIDNVVRFINSQSTSETQVDIAEDVVSPNNDGFEFGRDSQNVDALYQQAVSIVTQQQKASTSFIQRYLQIGYNRAARIIEHMEKEGIISEANHVGKRNVLKKN